MESGEVRVAEGIYNISISLVIKAGISVCGGYSGVDWTRDISLHETVIQASGVSPALTITGGITEDTLIEGFTIKAAWEDDSTCIYCNKSSPTIRHNIIDASLGIEDSAGIFNSSASPVIIANTINAGKGTDSCWGIANINSSPKIWNNVIYSDGTGNAYRGIVNANSSNAIIQNNTIDGGANAGAVMIYNSSSRSVIENNILYTAEGCCGIYEKGASSLPIRLNNNDFYKCDPLYAVEEDPDGKYYSLDALLAYLDTIQAEDNLDESNDSLEFENVADQNYHIKSGSAAKENGLNLSSFFSTDRDGNARTVLWSIGAYE